MEILFATRNAHKVSEVRALLADAGIDVILRTLDDFPEIGELPETHETFEGNALQKARTASYATGLTTVADDSGLEVDALGGAPGVHSKRYSELGTAESNNSKLLAELEGVEDRTAQFRCVVAVVGPDWQRTAEGRCEGRIGTEIRGRGGFGYDPLFLPDEQPGRTMAELSMSDKNAISHRGRAFRQLPELLPPG